MADILWTYGFIVRVVGMSWTSDTTPSDEEKLEREREREREREKYLVCGKRCMCRI